MAETDQEQWASKRHFTRVEDYLNGKEVDPLTLWLSVGYFLNGSGRFSNKKPWSSTEEKESLMRITRESSTTKMEGYNEAYKLEAKLEKVCKKFPMNTDNHLEWSNFIRTLETTLDILKRENAVYSVSKE